MSFFEILRMLKIYLCLFCCCLIIPTLLGSRVNRHGETTTSKPTFSLLDKFHQNDYKMNFEWAEISRVNKEFGDYKQTTFKYNRTTTCTNATFFVNVDFGYDIEVVAQMYRFASNEYRQFPMRFEVNLCQAIEKDILGTSKYAESGNFSCPLLKGRKYIIVNFLANGQKFPPLIPTGRYMMELQYLFHDEEVLVTKNYMNIYRPITVYED